MTHRRQCAFQPDFISPGECSELLAWARSMRPHLPQREPGRYFRKVSELPQQPALHKAMRLRIEQAFGLDESAKEEKRAGWYLGMGYPGSWIHQHRDATPPGTQILRCNLFLQVPTRGGLPIIEGAPFEVTDGTLLAFLSSELSHWSQPVEGRKRRIILSFGYTVPDSYRLPATPPT